MATRRKPPKRRKRVPTDRLTLAWCAAQGWLADLAERRRGPITIDYLGFADVVALTATGVAVAIQHTSAANLSSRRRKVLDSPQAGLWALAGGRVLVVGWRAIDQPPRVEDLTGRLCGVLPEPEDRKGTHDQQRHDHRPPRRQCRGAV